MVRPVLSFYRVQDLETASIFEVDSCIYLHAKEQVYSAKHKSLRDWIASKPHLHNRMNVLTECFLGQYSWTCVWCGEDQHACPCEVDTDGLVWVNGNVGVPFKDGDLPF